MSKNFLDLINSQRAESKIPKFKGTFLEYLEVLSDNKDIVMLAHKRLHNVIKDQGIDTIDVGDEDYRNYFNGEKIRRYEYFKKIRWMGRKIN